MWDDAANSFFSIQQCDHWHWHLWYTSEKCGPIGFWLRAIFYRFFPPSLFNMWLLQAFESSATLIVGYWASRQYVSKSLSFLFALILAFSFWPLYLGQFCSMEYLAVLWEFFCLGLFGLCLKSLSVGLSRDKLAVVLGFWLGLGYYIWVVAIPVIFILASGFLWTWARCPSKKLRTLAAFGVPLLLLSLPVGAQLFSNISSGHIHNYLVTNRSNFLSYQLVVSFSYLTVFLWGPIDKSYFNFGPLWGGFLNPFLGSAFLLGIIELFRFRRKPIFYWVVGIFLTCLLPGLLSNTSEMMRVLTTLPFCLILAALGLKKFLDNFSPQKRMAILTMILSCSMTLDFYHLWGPYHRWAVPDKDTAGSKSPEHFQAFQILEKLEQKNGAGLIFSDFYYNVFDQSLYVAAYGFNAAVNPKLDPSHAKWTAILLAPWDMDVIQHRFPSAVFYNVSEGLHRTRQGEMWMAVVPLSGKSGKAIIGWIDCYREIQGLFAEYPYNVSNPSYGKVLADLWKDYDHAPQEPFIRNSLMEKIIDASYQSSDISGAQPLLSLPLKALWHPPFFNRRYALTFHRLGTFAASQGKYAEAREAFERAAYFDPRYPLQKALAFLKQKQRN